MACSSVRAGYTGKEVCWPGRLSAPTHRSPPVSSTRARRGRAVDGQGSRDRIALDEFSLAPDDPHVAQRRRHTGEQNVAQEIPLRGIRTGRNTPGGAVPMQQQRLLASVAAGGEIGPERPDIRRRYGRDPKQTVRLGNAVRPHVRTGHHRPLAAIIVFDQRQRGAVRLAERRNRRPKRCLGPAPRPRSKCLCSGLARSATWYRRSGL